MAALKTVEAPEVLSPQDWLAREIERSKFERSIKPSVSVTPEMADLMLQRNEGNRRLFDAHVTKLATAMKAGEWIETHAGLAFDRNGRLLDGQHRLCAVRASGVTCKMDIHFGEAPEAFDRIDVGKGRSAGNILEIVGHNDGTLLAAIVRVLMAIDLGVHQVRPGTNHAVVEYLEKHPDLPDAAKVVNGIRQSLGKVQSAGGLGAAIYLIGKRMGNDGDTFFDKVKTGIGIKSDSDPIYHLRQRLIRDVGARLTPMQIAALAIKAFNYWHEGRQVKLLSWRAIDENFPVVGQ